MKLFTILLWAAGLFLLVFSLITGAGAAYHSVVMLLWSFPAGAAAGTAISELAMDRN